VQFKAVKQLKQVNMTHFGRLKLSSITEYTVFKKLAPFFIYTIAQCVVCRS